ncbi:MAG TPA: hypothetical protein VFV30_13245 [Novosphingobium sp.]|nr:hypothetical protein [Novosphingobium sp.]
MNRRVHMAAAAGAVIATLAFLRDWLAAGTPVLIAMALVVAAGVAYAVWNAFELVALFKASPSPAAPVRAAIPTPALAGARAASVRRIVDALAAEGVFAPDPPDPRSLHGPIAERDETPNQEVVLTALLEADSYDQAFDLSRHFGNLAFHDSKAEQFEETIAAQIADLARLTGPHLRIETVAIDLAIGGAAVAQSRCSIALSANGEPLTVQYRPAAKYLSTVLHVAVARRLRESGTDRRLAWLWNDQGVWLAALGEGAAQRLNTGPGKVRGGFGGWEWVDETEPFAAGDA